MLTADAPKGIKLPAGLQQAGFGRVTIGGDKRLAFALDAKSLWLDLNLNGDLGDEQPLAARQGLAWRHRPSVELGKDLTIVLTFYRNASFTDHLHYYPRMHRRGTVLLEGRVRLVGLADGNADLKFDDPEADRLYIDLDGDGLLAGQEAFKLGVAFPLRGAAYSARIGKNGSFVEFRRAKTVSVKPRSRWVVARLRKPAHPKGDVRASLMDLAARFERERSLSYPQRTATSPASSSTSPSRSS